MRIVSLLPAATEVVCALGLADQLVGISGACDFPPAVAGRAIVTRAGHPAVADAALLAGLRPDLVLAGAPPAAASAGAGELRAAAGPDASIVHLEPTSLEGIFHAIATIGAMADAEDEAVGLVEILRERLADIEEVVEARRDRGHRAPRVVALESLGPLRAAGRWIPEQVRRAGGWELLGVDGEPPAPTSWAQVREVDPEMVLVLPAGMHLREATRAWRAIPRPEDWDEIQAVRRGQVFVLDAEAHFSRPGPRVIDGIEVLAEILDPDGFVDLAPAGSWVPVR